MQVSQENWPIKDIVKRKAKINVNPQWQRGPAWKAPRKVLLIDSILRGMDIPKFYLRKLKTGPFSHDAVDGQQRLRSIWDFREDNLVLDYPEEPLGPIEGMAVAGKTYSELDKKLRDRFDAFVLCVGEITDASAESIKKLFSRLQMGVSLNPSELRNAMEGPLVYWVDAMARSHEFFLTAKISEERGKRQDYVTHACAMAAYQGLSDIKAPDLKKMIAEFGDAKADEIVEITKAVLDALTVLAKINKLINFTLVQKWIYVDLAWMIMQLHAERKTPNAAKIAQKYVEFEKLRRQFTAHPEEILAVGKYPEISKPMKKHLYDYIVAFKAQGATHGNLQIRNSAIRAFCL
jgi:Protein of unknown function DUF262